MKTLSFVIPAYNEKARVHKAIKALENFSAPNGFMLEEVIFVDDGSTDNTAQVLQSEGKQLKNELGVPLRVISYKDNRGKGFAIKTGMLSSRSDYTLFFDIDISTPLSELNSFAKYMKAGVPVIIGTRKNGHSTVIQHQPLYRELMGRVFTKISQIILNTNVSDFTCGFKAFSREATGEIFERQRIEGWGFDSEILFLAKKFGFKIKEVPVVWSNDPETKVNPFKESFKSLLELFGVRYNDMTGVYAREQADLYEFAEAPAVSS